MLPFMLPPPVGWVVAEGRGWRSRDQLACTWRIPDQAAIGSWTKPSATARPRFNGR